MRPFTVVFSGSVWLVPPHISARAATVATRAMTRDARESRLRPRAEGLSFLRGSYFFIFCFYLFVLLRTLALLKSPRNTSTAVAVASEHAKQQPNNFNRCSMFANIELLGSDYLPSTQPKTSVEARQWPVHNGGASLITKMQQDSKENEVQAPLARPVLGLKKRPQFKAPGFVHPAKKAALQIPMVHAKKPNGLLKPGLPAKSAAKSPEEPSGESYYFSVLYTKYQPSKKMRKNKAFNDGILEIKAGNKATLFEPEGKVVSTITLRGYTPSTLGNGSEIIMGNWELEVDAALPAERFTSGEAFIKSAAPSTATTTTDSTTKGAFSNRAPILNPSGKPFKRPVAPGAAPLSRPPPQQLHDPRAPGAVILNPDQWENGSRVDASGHPVAAVVLDPLLARHMRPHQIEGVKFLYECTMGIRQSGQCGAILADSMGLGKTLTTIALLWTLLRQSPAGKPTVAKAIVVTPSSLTRNWAAEVRKWLGDERLRTCIIPPGAEGASQAQSFRHGTVARVAIVSYETLRQHAATLAGCTGVLVADEGHRLKSAQGNKTISALLSLQCPRRVILSGTPYQNNLSEFFAMADFVCPDVLGSLPTFNRVFALPISRSRDRNASEEERTIGEARSTELARRVESFVLRRGPEVNASYLPPLSLYLVFCRPTEAQLNLLEEVLGSTSVQRLLGHATGSDFGDQTLSVLTNLRKICNHPALYTSSTSNALEGGEEESVGPDVVDAAAPALSGKMAALSFLLDQIVRVEKGRCVVVSQSTAMLDLISSLCATAGYTTVRIDGSTNVDKRQDTVDSFNRHGVGQIFLLSTTAGGAGLNLTGANRLILVDSHWNPAMDLQAMARVWRDGQKLPCVVYRLLTTGTLEEKVYQRQRAKGDIAAVTVGGAEGGGGAAMAAASKKGGQFSKEELKQLFTVRTDTKCDTADVLGVGEFPDCSEECDDGPLAAAVSEGLVSYVHLEKQQGGDSTDKSTNEDVGIAISDKAAASVEINGEQDEKSGATSGGSGDGASQLEINYDDDVMLS